MMDFDEKNKRRRSIRLPNYDYSQSGYYFVSICCNKRMPLFGEIRNGEMILNDFGKIAKEEWLKTGMIRKNIWLDEFVIMPNHMHGILVIDQNYGRGTMHRAPTVEEFGKPTSNTIPTIIRGYKSSATTRSKKLGFTDSLWQRNYHEHIIRNEKSLNEIREYIKYNPLKWENDCYYSF